VAASGDYDDPIANADGYLGRAVHEAAAGVQSEYDWRARADAVETVRNRLDPNRTRLAEARIAAGTAYRSRYNDSAARVWANANCPDGADRQFGPCEARRGVVVQERAGETHVLAVALDVTVTTGRGTTEMTLVVPSVETGSVLEE